MAAGDPLYDAFHLYLKAELEECGFVLPWTVKDTQNTAARPDASVPYVDFEITSAGSPQFTTGAPGYNLHQETGQIIIAWKVPLGGYVGDVNHQQLAGLYSSRLHNRCLSTLPDRNRFTCEDRQVRIHTPVRMGTGEDEGGMWVETMAVSYERFPIG